MTPGTSPTILIYARAIGSGDSGPSQKDAAHAHEGFGIAAMLISIDDGAKPLGKVAFAAQPSGNRADRGDRR